VATITGQLLSSVADLRGGAAPPPLLWATERRRHSTPDKCKR